MKLLVAEDEPALNQIIVKRLKIEGYSVDSAQNGAEALEYTEATEYDLLLVDIMIVNVNQKVSHLLTNF